MAHDDTPLPGAFEHSPRTPRHLERLPDSIDRKLDDLISTVATLGTEQKYLRHSQDALAESMKALESKFSRVVLGNGVPGLVGEQRAMSERLRLLEERSRSLGSLGGKVVVSAIGSGITILLGGLGVAVAYYLKSGTGG